MAGYTEIIIPSDRKNPTDTLILRARASAIQLNEDFSHKTKGFTFMTYSQMLTTFGPMRCIERSDIKGVQTWKRIYDPRDDLPKILDKVKNEKKITSNHLKPGKCRICSFSDENGSTCPIWRYGLLRPVAEAIAKRDKITLNLAELSLLEKTN